MGTKKEMTLEELSKQYTELSAQCKLLETEIAQKKQEDEDRRQAELALAKEARKNELEEAAERYRKLRSAYFEDYGYDDITLYESNCHKLPSFPSLLDLMF